MFGNAVTFSSNSQNQKADGLYYKRICIDHILRHPFFTSGMFLSKAGRAASWAPAWLSWFGSPLAVIIAPTSFTIHHLHNIENSEVTYRFISRAAALHPVWKKDPETSSWDQSADVSISVKKRDWNPSQPPGFTGMEKQVATWSKRKVATQSYRKALMAGKLIKKRKSPSNFS